MGLIDNTRFKVFFVIKCISRQGIRTGNFYSDPASDPVSGGAHSKKYRGKSTTADQYSVKSKLLLRAAEDSKYPEQSNAVYC
jgi:hypothetical protein